MYSVGFYVGEDEEDRVREVTVRMKPSGLRAVHPGKYVFRSPAVRKTSLLRAAWAAPEMFQSGIVRAHVFPLRPTGRAEWNGLLAVSFPVPLSRLTGPEAAREFGAMLYRGSRVVHRFSRRIALRPDGPDVTSEPLITFLEPVDLEPGSYTLSAVLSDPGAVDPHAARVTIEVPEIPESELFLVGPVLGRPSGPNLVVTGGGPGAASDLIGSESSFEPLLVQQVEGSVDLVALTQACLVGPKKIPGKADETMIRRVLLDGRGEVVGDLPDVDLEFEGDGRVHCSNLVDVLPAASVRPGQYEFQVVLDAAGQEEAETSSIRFAVGVADDR